MQTPSDLLDWLTRNLFLRPEQAAELRGQLAHYPDAHSLCKLLLARDWLTPYQVNQILQGKGESLIIGANRLLVRLGEGAMGQVYKAWNVRLSRVVAVKTIHKEHVASSKAMERFRREMQTAAQLDHPNIVLVRDADHAGSTPYLVMDYMEGIDLARLVKKEGPLPVHLAADFIRQAALGLQHAVERGIVHRDVKPGNLFLETRPGDKETGRQGVKILDFGLARFESEEDKRLTHVGNILGTVDYISPEQAQDAHSADTRSDIYSLGCTLYYLLAGKPPFSGNSLVEKITARVTGPPPLIRNVRPDVPQGLEDAMVTMMARFADARFQKPEEVAAALAPFTTPAIGATAVAPVIAPGPATQPGASEFSGSETAPTLPAPDEGPAMAEPVSGEGMPADSGAIVAAPMLPAPVAAAAPVPVAALAPAVPVASFAGSESGENPFLFASKSAMSEAERAARGAVRERGRKVDLEKWGFLMNRLPVFLQQRLQDPRHFMVFVAACCCLLVVLLVAFVLLVARLFR